MNLDPQCCTSSSCAGWSAGEASGARSAGIDIANMKIHTLSGATAALAGRLISRSSGTTSPSVRTKSLGV